MINTTKCILVLSEQSEGCKQREEGAEDPHLPCRLEINLHVVS